MDDRQSRLAQAQGIALMLAGCMFLTLSDAISKLLTTTYSIPQIICARGFIILALGVAICAWHGTLASMRPRSVSSQLRRAAYFVASTFLVNWSLKLLPLAVAHAVLFASPIIMTALAPLLLDERVGLRRWSAVIAGFIGIVLIIDPFGQGWHWAALVPLAAALAGALRDLSTRELAASESTMSLMMFMAGVTAVAGLALTPVTGWTMPDLAGAGLILAFGLTNAAAMFLQVLAFRRSEAGLLAPFKYSSILWSILLGFLLWGYMPTWTMLCGVAIVIASGLFILHREVMGRERRVPARDALQPAARLDDA